MANKHNRQQKRIDLDTLRAVDVQEGDFFILSPAKGYAGKQLREAMQVMECWPRTMTVKCSGGCMNKPYDHFQKITDLSGMDHVHSSDYFEDNRRTKEVLHG